MNPLQSPQVPVETVKAVVHRRQGSDPLDSLIAPHYIELYTHRSLQAAVAPLMKNRVTFSRFYPLQKIVVDFETKGRIWMPLEKRAWCHAHGIVYVPIAAHERLRYEDFSERLQAEREAFTSAKTSKAPTPPKEVPTIDSLLADPSTVIGLQTAVDTSMRGEASTGAARVKRADSQLRKLTAALKAALVAGDLPLTLDAVQAWVSVAVPPK